MVSKHNKKGNQHGQGIVEFAIVLPIVLLIVFGVIELGFLIFSYSSVNSASREAARYGIAIGNVTGGQRYYDCDGIVNAGLGIGRFAGMEADDFTIVYDDGPETATKYSSCEDLAAENGNDTISFGDRIVVTVNHDYRPIVSFMGLNIAPFNMTSSSSRTIVKNVSVIPGGGGSGSGGGGGGGGGGEEPPPCYPLNLQKSVALPASGSEPTPNPVKSADCTDDYTYVENEVVELTAHPDAGTEVAGWLGTDDDNLTTITNTWTMTNSSHTVIVKYAPAP